MRITGGQFRGRNLQVPDVGVRPTQDMVREALFNILQTRVPGCRFLDLFAGSGAVGLEALSRGAEFVCWVETGRRTVPILTRNVEMVAQPGTQIWKGDVYGYLKKSLEGHVFDIIFADPPYDQGRGLDSLAKLLDLLAAGTRLAPGGLFIMEQSVGEPSCDHPAWRRVDERCYGKTCLRFFRRADETATGNSVTEPLQDET